MGITTILVLCIYVPSSLLTQGEPQHITYMLDKNKDPLLGLNTQKRATPAVDLQTQHLLF